MGVLLFFFFFSLPVNMAPSFQVSDSSLLGPGLNITNNRSFLLPLTFQLLTSPLRSELIKKLPEQPYWSFGSIFPKLSSKSIPWVYWIFQKDQVNTLNRLKDDLPLLFPSRRQPANAEARHNGAKRGKHKLLLRVPLHMKSSTFLRGPRSI